MASYWHVYNTLTYIIKILFKLPFQMALGWQLYTHKFPFDIDSYWQNDIAGIWEELLQTIRLIWVGRKISAYPK